MRSLPSMIGAITVNSPARRLSSCRSCRVVGSAGGEWGWPGSRSYLASTRPSGSWMVAAIRCGFDRSADNVSRAACASPNASAAALLIPATFATMEISLISSWYSAVRLKASSTAPAIMTDAVAEATPSAVSLRVSDSLRNQLWMRMVVFHDGGEAEQPRAEVEPGALCGLDVDGEPHLAALDEHAGDAARLGKSMLVADGQHRRILQPVDDLLRALRVEARQVEDMAGEQRIGLHARHDDRAAADGAPFHGAIECEGDHLVAEHADRQRAGRRGVGRPFRKAGKVVDERSFERRRRGGLRVERRGEREQGRGSQEPMHPEDRYVRSARSAAVPRCAAPGWTRGS